MTRKIEFAIKGGAETLKLGVSFAFAKIFENPAAIILTYASLSLSECLAVLLINDALHKNTIRDLEGRLSVTQTRETKARSHAERQAIIARQAQEIAAQKTNAIRQAKAFVDGEGSPPAEFFN